jgi:RND family efflux transporter MFP subunit
LSYAIVKIWYSIKGVAFGAAPVFRVGEQTRTDIMKKNIWIIILVVCVGLVGWQVYRKIEQAGGAGIKRNGPMAVAVETAPVRRQTVRRIGEFSGTLTPKSQFYVAPKVPGRLEKMLVNIGDALKTGDLVALLDQEEYIQQVKQAEAELDVAKANLAEADSALEVARSDYARRKKLIQRQATSLTEAEIAEAKYLAADAKRKVALAQIAQKEAALKAAEIRLSYTEIYASWEGGSELRKVSERFVDEGAMLRANDPIVSVVDVSTVIGVIHVIERDYPSIHMGQKAFLHTDAYPNQSFTGEIIRISPVIKESSRQARVEIEVPNPSGKLAPGMFVRAVIQFEEHPDAVTVPINALVKRNGQSGVFVADMETKTARFVPVVTGITNNSVVEVVEPKLDGRVVTLGHHLLTDGTAIMTSGGKANKKASPEPGKSKPSPEAEGKPGGRS